ncbi:MAG: transglycosylase SLT domain-containing protein [Bacteroidota bacterium]|nr:transglycosylase SLT domain-containing protein [Bacteroidota bacterium]
MNYLLSYILLAFSSALNATCIHAFPVGDTISSMHGSDSLSSKIAPNELNSTYSDPNTLYFEQISQRPIDLLDSITARKPKSILHSSFNSDEAANNDSLIQARLKHLSEKMEIPLDYNVHVKAYIHAYALKNPDKISRILGEQLYYFPIFEDYFGKYNLPPELKYLAAVESALDPFAVSKSGAVGLWQFLPGTAGLFDLEINAYVDERRDAFLSTDAACRYIEYLYRIYGDWHLVLASYNGGPGAVQKAIARSGGERDYWKLREHISEQMQNYVPAFIAMTYVMNYYHDFGIVPEIPKYTRYHMDTLLVYESIGFDQISQTLPISVEKLRVLNPLYRKDLISASEYGHTLVLPLNLLIEFVIQFETIRKNPESLDTLSTSTGEKKLVTVKPGDSLHKLAIRHFCTIDDIIKWNNISRDYQLHAGETLIIYMH